MLKKKYINTHKSILQTKYLINNTTLKFHFLNKCNFFFSSISKKEILSILKNISVYLMLGQALNAQYSRLHINQNFNNLCYLVSLTKSFYTVTDFYKFQKLFIILNYVFLYLAGGKLTSNSFYAYTNVKPDVFFDSFLLIESKYLQQKTYLTGKLNWHFDFGKFYSSNEILVSPSSLFFFDMLNLSAIPFFSTYIEKKEIKQLLLKIK